MVWGDSARKLKMNENMNPLRERCFQHYLEGLVEHDKSIFIDYPYLDQLLCSLYDGLLMAQTRIIPGAILNRRSARLKETLVARLEGLHKGTFFYIGGQVLYYAFLASVVYDPASKMLQ